MIVKGIHALMHAILTAASLAGMAVLIYRFLWAKQLCWRAKPLGKAAGLLTLSALAGRCMLPKTVRPKR